MSEMGSGEFILFCMFVMGFVGGAILSSMYDHYFIPKPKNTTVYVSDNQFCNASVYMCNLVCGKNWTRNGPIGMAFVDGDVFCVNGKMSISETLETCAHEWAHTHEGLVDGE